jgi:acyl-lipid omega-6 desaturase (Delta-12 desaturase)
VGLTLPTTLRGFSSAKASRVPNYNLERCHKSQPIFRGVTPVTLFSSFGASRFRLWDERLHRLVAFRHLKDLRRRAKGAEKKDSVD